MTEFEKKYHKKWAALVRDAARASEFYGDDECERFAAELRDPGFGDPAKIDDYRAFGPEPDALDGIMGTCKDLQALCAEYLDKFSPGWREKEGGQ
jgi:hypothetical protein